MEFKGKEDRYKNTSIIDFIEELIEKKELHEKTLISFQPCSLKSMYSQEFLKDVEGERVSDNRYSKNCLETVIEDCNAFTGQKKIMSDFKNKNVSICSAICVHRIYLSNSWNIYQLLSKMVDWIFLIRIRGYRGVWQNDILLYIENI